MSDRNRSSRRDFLTSWFDAFRDASKVVVKAGKPDPAKVLRPPGALTPDGDFLAACTRCGDCIPVCPVEAVITIEEEDGRKLPAINPGVKPCRLCDDLPCIAACPDGALVAPDGGPARVRIGIAKVDPRHLCHLQGRTLHPLLQGLPLSRQGAHDDRLPTPGRVRRLHRLRSLRVRLSDPPEIHRHRPRTRSRARAQGPEE